MAALQTRVIAMSATQPEANAISEAAGLIRDGQVVAFPTETVYGLGGDALQAAALQRIYAAKGRPPDNPLILHIADRDQLLLVAASVPELAARLAQTFWPGPLTLVLAKTPRVPDIATGGLPTVAVRMPDHAVALALIRQAATPLAAPSANRSGRPSPTTSGHVLADLDGIIPLILDGGPTVIGVESTVLDVTCTPPVLLRPGGVPREALETVIGPIVDTADVAQQRRSPGLRYRHYSPRAHVLLLEEARPDALQHLVLAARRQHQRLGCLLHRLEIADVPSGLLVQRVEGDVANYARRLFATLRELDAQGVDAIIVEGVPEVGLGAAIMDRLRRASLPTA